MKIFKRASDHVTALIFVLSLISLSSKGIGFQKTLMLGWLLTIVGSWKNVCCGSSAKPRFWNLLIPLYSQCTLSVLTILYTHIQHYQKLRYKDLHGSAAEIYLLPTITEDGWKIPLLHYRPETNKNHLLERLNQGFYLCDEDREFAQTIDREYKAQKYPILMCHGLSSNRFAFDTNRYNSLAKYLACKGFEVWVMELRGSSLSFYSHHTCIAELRKQHPYGWNFDDYLKNDIPSAINFVRSFHKVKKVHWIGHSMGGMLGLSYISKADSSLASVTAIGSSLCGFKMNSAYEAFLPLTKPAKYLPKSVMIPYGVLVMLLAPFMGYVPNFIQNFQFDPKDPPDGPVIRKFFRTAFHSIPLSLLFQLQTTLDNPKGLRDSEGNSFIDQIIEASKQNKNKCPKKIVLLCGSTDVQTSVESVQNTANLLESYQGTIIEIPLGKKYGNKQDYGHFDMLLGKNAYEEVFPLIYKELEYSD